MITVARIFKWTGDLTLIVALSTAITINLLKHSEAYKVTDPFMIQTIEPWAFPSGHRHLAM
jgi:hypothetical protein